MKRALKFWHEWVQALPLSANEVVCTKCGHRTAIGQWDSPCAKGQMVPLSWLPAAERAALEAE